MNIKEFEEELKKIDKDTSIEHSALKGYTHTVLLDWLTMVRFDINDSSFMGIGDDLTLSDEKTRSIIDLSLKFMQTPVDERLVPRRFYLRHKWLCDARDTVEDNYLRKYAEWFVIGKNINDYMYQSTFTLKEIEEIKKKFDTDLADFEMVEVDE